MEVDTVFLHDTGVVIPHAVQATSPQALVEKQQSICQVKLRFREYPFLDTGGSIQSRMNFTGQGVSVQRCMNAACM